MTDLIETLLFSADVHSDEKEGEESSISLMCIRAVGEIRRLKMELEHERNRLDWALTNEAVYYQWGGVWRLCFQLAEGPCQQDIDTTDPRATIDSLMVQS